jgi:hypothetical protein
VGGGRSKVWLKRGCLGCAGAVLLVVLVLAGDWKTDSEVQVTVAFGTGHLRIPEGVGVRGLEGEFERFNRSPRADGTELGPPVLDMNAHYDAGLIQVSVVPEE